MKKVTFLLLGVFWITACKTTIQKEVILLDRPGQTELTQTKHVKMRNGKENRDRVKYYNSLQYKNNFRPQN